MSGIGPGIAGSISQALVQQSQIARKADAARNRDQQQAQKLRDMVYKHVHEVEDSAEADSDRVRINREQRESEHRRKQRQADREYQQFRQPGEGDDDSPHIDIEA